MDPDVALRELRAAIIEHHRLADSDTPNDAVLSAAEEVVRYAEALDGWLSAGGFPPAAWAGPGVG